MGIKSMDRYVRTRLYFTSESHLHSLFNILRFSGFVAKEKGKEIAELPSEAKVKLSEMAELGYLTHIIIRLYEIISRVGPESSNSGIKKKLEDQDPPQPYPQRFRISVSLGDGVVFEKITDSEEKNKIFEKLRRVDDGYDLCYDNSESDKDVSHETDDESSKSMPVSRSYRPTAEEKVTEVLPPEHDWVSKRCSAELRPCAPMIRLWDNLAAADFDKLVHFAVHTKLDKQTTDQ
mmetsp:Transcript_14023/g.17022  ORF Transcript_14023/g.17022 Transcript_14023/m.17022 type:complete len:234 (-) Transcript_14023:123-824(-)